MSSDKEKVQQLLSSGSELAGAAVGAALGFFAGGPTTAAGSAVLGLALTKGTQALLADFANRHLSHREEMRVGAVAALVIEGLQKRLEKGEQPRDDGFFESSNTGRSKAKEIFEGVLQKGKNDYEEKKLKYYANIFITAAFDEKFTSETINHVLSVADRLSYRQLCLLSLFSRPQPFALRNRDYHSPPHGNDETANVLAEIFDLCQQSLVRCYKPGSKSAKERIPILGLSDIRPSWMVRISFGDRLYELMQLYLLSNDDLKTVAEILTNEQPNKGIQPTS